jgi:hypothetical protein
MPPHYRLRGKDMTLSVAWDLRAKAELLTYLIVAHLLERKQHGKWLAVTEVVERERRWFELHEDVVPWLERISISSWSRSLAIRLESGMPPLSQRSCEKLLKRSARTLDFRVALIRFVYLHSFNHLSENGWFFYGRLRAHVDDDRR